jgi:hypothetical protein
VVTSQYSPATMLAAGKFKRYIKRQPKSEDTAAAAGGVSSRRASQDRRSSRHGSQDKLPRAGAARLAGSQAGRVGGVAVVAARLASSQDRLVGRAAEGGGGTSRLLRLSGLEMGRTKSDSQRRRKGFGLNSTDSTG